MSVSVSQAAERLGISRQRVRALLRAGRLAGQRLGREWLIDEASVDRLSVTQRLVGRPLSARSAWAVLNLLNGREPVGLSRSELRRAIERATRARDMAPNDMAQRAGCHSFLGHPGILRRLGDDPRVVLGGVSAAGYVGADIMAPGMFEGYLRAEDRSAVVAAYRLRPPPDGVAANVIMRFPNGPWPFDPDTHVAPGPVVAVDLIDAGDERSVRAGRALLTARGGTS